MESTIWTEKYRPSNFEDMKGQQHVVNRIKSFVEQKNMPHLLFSGPAGVGKTTLSLIIAKQLFGESWRSNFLELNASDERGIDIVRIKVKDFARTRAIGDVPFKIIYLDECDALTKEAQQALRRTMENFTKTCRFVLSCNYSSKIIDPIQSRCAVFKFKPLPKEDIKVMVDKIAKSEEFRIWDDAFDALYLASNGDARKVTNILQSCLAVAEPSKDLAYKDITADLVYSLASQARPQEVREFLDLALKQNFQDARRKLLDTMLNYGLSGLDIIKQIETGVWDLDLDNRKKVELIDKCGEVEFRLVEGSDEYIQLEALLAFVMLLKIK
ncbi:MAG: replication factor C small subunit [Candidatus Woesearchaeota archaeon]